MQEISDANELAESLYEFRSSALFHLTDEEGLPDYLSVPLWQAVNLVFVVIRELEKRHGCREEGVIEILGNELPD